MRVQSPNHCTTRELPFWISGTPHFDSTKLADRVSQVAQQVNNSCVKQKTWVRSLGWEDPQRRVWQPIPVFLLRECHGQRSLWATVHRVAKSQARMKQLSTHKLADKGFSTDLRALVVMKLAWVPPNYISGELSRNIRFKFSWRQQPFFRQVFFLKYNTYSDSSTLEVLLTLSHHHFS